MGALFVLKDLPNEGRKTLVRGKVRIDWAGVKTFDGKKWRGALSKWQIDELVKKAKRKRSVDGVLKEIGDIADPIALEALEKCGGIVAEAVKEHKIRLWGRVT